MFLFHGNNRRTNVDAGGGYCMITVMWVFTTWRKVTNKIAPTLMGGLLFESLRLKHEIHEPLLTWASLNTNEYVEYAIIFENRTLWIRIEQEVSCVIKNGFYAAQVIFSVFIRHVIKSKSCKRSINQFRNLGYDRWLQYKKPRRESGLCNFKNSINITSIFDRTPTLYIYIYIY